jgi:hypothetical protein
MLASPPDPALNANWRAEWKNRLESVEPWLPRWLSHQSFDAYWKHGSICTDFSAIKCPVLMASGWADGYSNAVPALLTNMPSNPTRLVRAVNGPWSHNYPHMAYPGPRVDWLTESVRWFDYCLKQDPEATRVWTRRPPYMAYIQEREEPSIIVTQRPGYWVSESEWPSKGISNEILYLTGQNGLALARRNQDDGVVFNVTSPLSAGLDCGRLVQSILKSLFTGIRQGS